MMPRPPPYQIEDEPVAICCREVSTSDSPAVYYKASEIARGITNKKGAIETPEDASVLQVLVRHFYDEDGVTFSSAPASRNGVAGEP